MIYIQSDKERKNPHHFDAACALFGAIDTGKKYRLTSFEEIDNGIFDSMIRRNTFVGSVEFMQKIFSRTGIEPYFPLRANYKITTLSEIRKNIENEKMFVKPVELRLFTGLVVDKYSLTSLDKLPDNTAVFMRKPFSSEIVSEWRCYVHNGKVVDMHCYCGDFFASPERVIPLEYVKQTECTESDIPISYTIDVAVLKSGQTELIEFNDMWAIGNYGVDNKLYLRMLEERYRELVPLPSF